MKILDKDNNEVIFKKEPIKCFCPYCNNNIITLVELKNGFLSYLLSIITFLTIGILPSIFVVPLVLILTKTLVHRCSVCLNDLGTDGRVFTLINFHEKILTFKFGELGFILTRKIIIGLFLGFILLIIIVYKLQNLPYLHDHHEIFLPIDETWENFTEECGRDKVVFDAITMIKCSDKFIDKSIHDWSGYVIRVTDYRESFYKYLHHAVVLLIKMVPEESEINPDLMLTFDTDEAEKYKDFLSDINRGQKLGFNGTIKSIGADLQPKHVHALAVWKENGFIEISPLINLQGRYSEKNNLRRIKNG